jgi:glucose/arabinose dehydrogenase
MAKQMWSLGLLVLVGSCLSACNSGSDGGGPGNGDGGGTGAASCQFITESREPQGGLGLQATKVVTGLEVPWAIGILPNGDWLVSERPGRIRLVRDSRLVEEPVLTLDVANSGGETGLLGLAIDPAFGSNHRFYIYYTLPGSASSRVARYRLADDEATAALEAVIVDALPAANVHSGGRLKFGPDGALYAGVGDSRNPELAQDPGSRAGKLLRFSTDGSGISVFASGMRNPQAFNWVDAETVIVADHGPTGELNLTGRDEISLARAGANLGWPRISGCDSAPGFVTPFLSWETALPPGDVLPFRGKFLVTALGRQELNLIGTDGSHEAYFQGTYGRLRALTQAPDGSVLMTTSNCDGRGECPADKDAILRVTGG